LIYTFGTELNYVSNTYALQALVTMNNMPDPTTH
jgi:hypothetical protein